MEERVRYGLPTFIQSYFYMPDFKTENMCFEDNSTLFNITNKSIIGFSCLELWRY